MSSQIKFRKLLIFQRNQIRKVKKLLNTEDQDLNQTESQNDLYLKIKFTIQIMEQIKFLKKIIY